jgi:hypothetical protein
MEVKWWRRLGFGLEGEFSPLPNPPQRPEGAPSLPLGEGVNAIQSIPHRLARLQHAHDSLLRFRMVQQ